MNKTALLLPGLFLLLFYISCQHEALVPGHENEAMLPDTAIQKDSAYFNTDVLPLFISNCAHPGCHTTNDYLEEYDLSHYTGIMKGIVPGKPMEGVIMHEINTGHMPPGTPLSPQHKRMLNKWIIQGAHNNTSAHAVDTNIYSYSTTIKPLIDTYCKGCHNIIVPRGGITLDTYEDVKTHSLSGKLLCSIEQADSSCSPMPKGGAAIPAKHIARIKKWVAEGALNN